MTLHSFSQEKIHYKNSKNSLIEFSISDSEYFVSFNENQRISFLKNKLIANSKEVNKNSIIIKNDSIKGKYDERKFKIAKLLKDNFTKIEPVLVYKDGIKQLCNGELIIKVTNKSDVAELFTNYNIDVKPNKLVNNQFIVKITDINTFQLFELVNKLQSNKKVEFVEPNFIRLIKPFTSDPYYNYQWAINNQGYLGGAVDADMDVDEAWTFDATGQGIKVAVIDTGVDLNHPDLMNNLLSGYDTTGDNSNGATQGVPHGTACAGIIAAVTNNIGVSGISYNAKIMPVRVFPTIGSPTNDMLANGITWAYQNGADIISNSWGGGSNSDAINNAIHNAITNGRNNKGCVILFSTGNDDSVVEYPAILEDVIAVGATSMCDERKSPNSCDGENAWGSNYGNEIDVVAPGVKIYTTDIFGSAGYNSGDYVSNFNGTSSACPNAAGVAALILSVNSNLNQSQVREILESTTDKISNYNYATISSHPSGTWNNEVGYGRLNAKKAIIKAKGGVNGPVEFCIGTQAVYTYTNSIPKGATITWEYPTNRMYIISGQGTPNITFGAFSSGIDNIIKAKITNNGDDEFYGKISNILYSGSSAIPEIIVAPDSPLNLICCGFQTFRQAVCNTNCFNLEWQFNILYQDPSDYYFFNTSSGYITAQKNTYSPLILNVKARNIPENCGNPSGWSNEISRYYGTVSSTNNLLSTSQINYNSEVPLNEYYSNIDNNLYIKTVDLYVWLEAIFGNRNLDNNEVEKIKTLIKNKNAFKDLKIQIYNFYGVKIFDKNFKQGSNIINLSNFENGIYFIKYYYGGISNTKTIIKN